VVAMTYTSHARKEGRWWVVQNDQVPGAISQVTRLDKAAEAQREAIAFVEEIDAESIEVLVRVSISPDIDREVEEAAALRAEAQQREQRSTELRRGVALRLEAEGYTIRDIGVVLGVSYQRVHQLTHAN